MPRPTIADVARQAKVSRSTVDRILAGRPVVRAETAARVLAAAEEVGFYAVPALRQRLRVDLPRRTFGIVLQQAFMPFHHALGEAFQRAAVASAAVRAETRVEYCADLKPDRVAAQIERLGAVCEALAVVTADHPLVTRVIDQLSARGIPVFAAVSALSAESRAAYIGVDNRKLGRTAAWFITRLAKRPGKVAILLGSHRHMEQEQREMGFRSYVREHAPDLQMLEPFLTHEVDDVAAEVVSSVTRRHRDLVGMFIAGGGIGGVLDAFNDSPRESLCAVAVERTNRTERALIGGILTAALTLPIERIAEALIEEMVARTVPPPTVRPNAVLLPFEISVSENV